MIDSAISDKLISYFERLIVFYKDFLRLETDKYDDVKSGRLNKLDAKMKKEQAFVMKAKGLEIERQKLMDKTEKPQATFREIIPLFELAKRERAQKLYAELSAVLLELKKTNILCNELTKAKLRKTSAVLSKIKNQPELNQAYNAKLQRSPTSAGFLSKKI